MHPTHFFDLEPGRLRAVRGVVFDLDGTLLDTEAVFRDIVFEVTGTLGFAMTHDVHSSMVGSSHERTNELLIEAYGAGFPYPLFDAECRRIMHARMEEDAVPLKRGAAELVLDLRARGLPLAVATSSRSHHALPHLARAGLLDSFDAIVTRDDVVNPKPHPEPYLAAARRIGIAPDACLALEDSYSGVRAAHAAGLLTVMVPDLVMPNEDVARLCAAVLPTLDHLRSALAEA